MRAFFAGALIILSAHANAQSTEPHSARTEYPKTAMQFIVPWASGGATDAIARVIAELLGEELKQRVNVVNRTGAAGLAGHRAIAEAAADGYTVGMITVEITMMHHLGLTPLRHTDYAPLALMSADAAGVNVRADAPYKSLKDLIAAIKANPRKLKGSGTSQGGIWHLAMAGLLRDQGIDPTALAWVPSNGAPPALRDLLAGDVEVVPCSMPEARAMIDAGKVRTLAIMAARPPALYPALPTLKDELHSGWRIAAWRAVVAPKGIPAEAQRVLVAALRRVHEAKAYRDFMAGRGFATAWADPPGTATFMAESDANLGAALRALGLAK